MNDEELLQALARLSREETSEERSRLDQRWDCLSAGDLSEEERAELQELAASSPEHAQALDAFSPLDEAFRSRTAGLLHDLTAAAAPRREETATAPWWSWFRLGHGWLGPATARAVVILVVLLPLDAPQPLPEYTAELRGGVQELRGADRTTRHRQTGARAMSVRSGLRGCL